MVFLVMCSLDRIERHIVIFETGRFIAAWICLTESGEFEAVRTILLMSLADKD